MLPVQSLGKDQRGSVQCFLGSVCDSILLNSATIIFTVIIKLLLVVVLIIIIFCVSLSDGLGLLSLLVSRGYDLRISRSVVMFLASSAPKELVSEGFRA